MKIGFLYAGQGQQFLNMGIDFYNDYPIFKDIVDNANSLINIDYLDIVQDSNKLSDTRFTQPAILSFSYGITKCLENHKIKPAIVAGLSLGEYNALLSSNVLSFNEALPLIKERANIMSNALPLKSSGMAAILKADITEVEKLLDQPLFKDKVAICNYNTFDQVVIGGDVNLLDEAISQLKEAGFKRVIKLDVSIVSHMALLNEASTELLNVLNKYSFKKPDVKFINNIEACYQDSNFTTSLAKQIAFPTLMAKSIQLMLEDGVDTFIEIGPGSANSGFVKSIAKELSYQVSIYKISNVAEFNKVIEEIGDVNE